MQGGFAETDETVDKDRPIMGTSQLWQVVAWVLLYPGEIHVHISIVNINESNVTILWHLRSNRYKSIKGKALSDIDKLSERGVLLLTLTAVLGDGTADIVKVIKGGRVYEKAVIEITTKNIERWGLLLERLRKMGFKYMLSQE